MNHQVFHHNLFLNINKNSNHNNHKDIINNRTMKYKYYNIRALLPLSSFWFFQFFLLTKKCDSFMPQPIITRTDGPTYHEHSDLSAGLCKGIIFKHSQSSQRRGMEAMELHSLKVPKEEEEEQAEVPASVAPTIDLYEEKEKLDLYIQKQSSSSTDINNEERIIDTSNIQYSIDNEIDLKKFIKIIQKEDRGIIERDENLMDTLKLLDTLLTKTLDTIEDAILMLQRKINESNYKPIQVLDEWNDPSLSHKPRLLVIGSGWASHAFIKVIDTSKYRVLNVSPTNYFVFTPMLASSSVGTTDIRSIVEAVRDSNPTVQFLEGSALNIDVETQRVQVKLGDDTGIDSNDVDYDTNRDNNKSFVELEYDILVYGAGVGPLLSSSRTPGLNSKHVHFLKSVNDAKRLRSSVITLLERASQPNISDEERRRLLTFVIIGAGPTGVEYTGELEDFLSDVIGFGRNVDGIKRSVAPFANLADFTRVILVQGAKDVLPQFDEDLRASARDVLEKEGVEVLTNTRVTRIESERVIISSQMENGESMEKTINCGIIVWAGGTKPIKLTEQLISNIDTYYVNKHNIQHEAISSLAVNGRIPVDKWLRVVGTPGNVLAMGDASVTVGKNTRVLPQTAQVAAQQGAYVARLLNRDYKLSGESMKHNTSEGNNDEMEKDGQANLYLNPPYNVDAMNGNLSTKLRLRGAVSAKPFEFLNLGQLAYLGGGEALSQVQLGDRHLFNQAGSSGFLLWKSVYIVKQVSTKTRLLVLFDWFSTKIFGRDVTRM